MGPNAGISNRTAFLRGRHHMFDTVGMRILQVAAPAHAGGLESVVLQLTGALCDAGHKVLLAVVIGPGDGNHPVPKRARELGAKVMRIEAPPRAYHVEYRALVRLIKAFKPDVVHTHGYRTDLIGGLAAQHSGVPWVATAHGFTGGGPKNRIYEWLQVRAYRRANALGAVSRNVRDRLLEGGVPPELIRLLPNAWAPKPLLTRRIARLALGIQHDNPLLGWVGRLSPEKGPDVFIEALALLRDLQWEASIIGEGRERRALQEQAKRLGLSDRLHWHGLVPGAAAYFPAFDAWVQTSRTEGTPIALFEAMGARVPIVATAVGGVPDVVTQAEALLVSSERPDAIAAALASILDDPRAAAFRAVSAAERLVESFSVDDWLHSHLELYESVRITR